MKKTTIAVVSIGVYLAFAGIARAQGPAPTKNIFLDVNFGVQANSQKLNISTTPVIYGEIAFIDSSQEFKASPLLDVTAGYRVWKDLSVALGLTTTFNKSTPATVSASIPSPVFFDRRVVTNATVTDLNHKERSAQLLVMWSSPITDKIDGTVMAGPSFIKVFQGVPLTSVAAGTQTPTFSVDEKTATKTGLMFGGDVTFLLRPKMGIGVMARYTAAKVELAGVPDVRVGGFQLGGGLRLRF
jgi:hypothetical protein